MTAPTKLQHIEVLRQMQQDFANAHGLTAEVVALDYAIEAMTALAPPSGEGVGKVFAWMKPDCSDVVLAKHRVDRWINVYTIPLYTTPQSAPVDGGVSANSGKLISDVMSHHAPKIVHKRGDSFPEYTYTREQVLSMLWDLQGNLTTPPPASQERGGYVQVRADVVAFLNGASQLDGRWFGDDGPIVADPIAGKYKHQYWWRKYLQDGYTVASIDAAEQAKPVTVENAPIGTIAPAIGGGHWYRVQHGWKWNGPNGSGGTFPRPGGDWNGKLTMPVAEQASPDDYEAPCQPTEQDDEQAKPTFQKVEDRSHEIFIADGMDGDPPVAEQAQAGEDEQK